MSPRRPLAYRRGAMSNPTKKCENCDGQGTIVHREYQADPPPNTLIYYSNEIEEVVKPCYQCKGAGVVEANDGEE